MTFFKIMQNRLWNRAVFCLMALAAFWPGPVLTSPNPIGNTVALPEVGAHWLQVLSPTMLELTLVTTKEPEPAPIGRWDFVGPDNRLRLPKPDQFSVMAGDPPMQIEVKEVGFKRRALYAPLKTRDLRIGNYLYLRLSRPIGENIGVEVRNPDQSVWPRSEQYLGNSDSRRLSPAVHVNQVGYLPNYPKKAMVGYYLGNLGELEVTGVSQGGGAQDPSRSGRFQVISTADGREAYGGTLRRRADAGFTFPCYQQVFEADFSELKSPGEYQLSVVGLGRSFPFRIGDEVAGVVARTYALGLYHQRCGTANSMPYTRFGHGPCHTNPAMVPLPAQTFSNTWRILASKTEDAKKGPRHTAPRLTSPETLLYPYVRKGTVDVSGGHHDAGDYSKYTINSAGLVHMLMTAVDVLPGTADLDNLGLPESGDGIGDLLQEAKWEADFLAKLQDEDGGFYFLVYPRDREYENNVFPDKGDPQVVWPKTTSATAAGVAALAQCASSPRFKAQYPEVAKAYLERARKGWAFLQGALARHGRDGAYQKITHYGNEFMHDDELAWAACELFLATGEPAMHQQLTQYFDPGNPDTRKWSWMRMYEGYGCAIRSYALAARAGKTKAEQLDAGFLAECENEMLAQADEQLRRASESAYGTSFPTETKRVRSAGWYFSDDAAFDLAVACQLTFPALNDPRGKYLEAILSNLNYESGCNPVNVAYLTGVGWKRQHTIVDQYTMNCRQSMPPPGIPLGNIQSGFGWLDAYKKELGALSFPPDGAQDSPYPFYDRWGDSFNLSQEYVILNQGRGLAVGAWLMAGSPLARQAWRPVAGRIMLNRSGSGPGAVRVASLQAPGVDLTTARILWEGGQMEPVLSPTSPVQGTPSWLEAEAQLPDGRFVFGTLDNPPPAQR